MSDLRMSELRIRPAAAQDVPAVLAFWRIAAEGTSVSDAIRSPSSRILAAKLTAFGV